MKSNLATSAFILALGLGLSTAPAHAHHAFSRVDREAVVNLTGTVQEFRWTQPHGWVLLDVQDPDATINGWSIETPPPTVLARLGWSRYSLMPGQHVRLTIHPFKDGSRSGSLINATLRNGRVLPAE
jgi:hypothetical protein